MAKVTTKANATSFVEADYHEARRTLARTFLQSSNGNPVRLSTLARLAVDVHDMAASALLTMTEWPHTTECSGFGWDGAIAGTHCARCVARKALGMDNG